MDVADYAKSDRAWSTRTPKLALHLEKMTSGRVCYECEFGRFQQRKRSLLETIFDEVTGTVPGLAIFGFLGSLACLLGTTLLHLCHCINIDAMWLMGTIDCLIRSLIQACM